MTAPSPAPSARPARVAVVGAGVSGLLCARSLSEAGVDVVLFDKGRGPGGRLSSRRLPEPEGAEALRVDHGAVDLCAPGPALAELLREAEAAGVLGRWQPREAVRDSAGQLRPLADPPARWVGLPSMSALARHWALELGDRGVNVNVVEAGLVDTDSTRRLPGADLMFAGRTSKTMVGDRQLEATDVADAVLFLSSPLADLVQGQTLVVDGGAAIHV